MRYCVTKIMLIVLDNFLMFSVFRDAIPSYDIAIIGTGIVGLATARELIMRYPNFKYIVVDKEDTIGIVKRHSY